MIGVAEKVPGGVRLAEFFIGVASCRVVRETRATRMMWPWTT
jgi:hypothetical protein